MTGSISEALPELAEAQAAPGQPEPTLRALDGALATLVGHKLFTVLVHDPDAEEDPQGV